MDVDSAEEVQPEDEEVEDEELVPVRFTPVELYLLSEYFNDENATLSEDVYKPIAKKLLINAAAAGLYDEVL